MNGFNYVLTKQVSWANRNNIELVGSAITRGKQTYTKSVSENLFEPILPETKIEISKGDGGELNSSASQSAKICAVHSSSAIGVNVLQYWKDKSINDLTHALGLAKKGSKSSQSINFEQKFKISKIFRFDPNIDAVIFNSKKSKIKVYGIECKFTEAYSSRKHPGLKEKYLTEINDQWKDISNLHKLAKAISPNDETFFHLHPAQLIKHILGLKKEYGKSGFCLLYLWYDVLGAEGCRHRDEIKRFAEITNRDNINFHSISYQKLIFNLKRDYYLKNEKYVDYLIERYL
jgi:hypothetical protein